MKYLVLAIFSVGAVVGSAMYLNHNGNHNALRAISAGTADVENVTATEPNPSVPSGTIGSSSPSPRAEAQSTAEKPQAPAPVVTRLDKAMITEAVDLLISNQAGYDQKQAAWKQLRESGGLDEAISELQQRAANNPGCAECAAVLGHAYLNKCATTSDVREQGILAMQADKLFDSALTVDPANWEARFTKAVALSYWPASMGKGDEVVQHFLTLIQQQETQPQQAHFADPYVWLGDQYQKLGHADDAHSVWTRGAALFPENQKLSTRLAAPR
jgi:hypothetical protein